MRKCGSLKSFNHQKLSKKRKKSLNLYIWFSMSSHKYRRMAKDKCASNLVYSHIWLHVPKDGSHFFYMFLVWSPICLYKKNSKKNTICSHYAPNTFHCAIHAGDTHLYVNLDSWPLISNFNKHFGAFLHAFFSSFASSSSCMKLRNHSWNKVIEVVELWVKIGDKSLHLTFCRISLDKLSSAFLFVCFVDAN